MLPAAFLVCDWLMMAIFCPGIPLGFGLGLTATLRITPALAFLERLTDESLEDVFWFLTMVPTSFMLLGLSVCELLSWNCEIRFFCSGPMLN